MEVYKVKGEGALYTVVLLQGSFLFNRIIILVEVMAFRNLETSLNS